MFAEMELELSQTLSIKLGCIAGQHSAVTGDFFFFFFFVTFPLKSIFLNPFDLNVPNLVAIVERKMSCKVFL